MRLLTIVTASLFSLQAIPAVAKDSCAGIRVREGPAGRRGDAALVTRAGKQHVTPAQIGDVLADGPWRFVFATPAEAERGVFFFHKAAKGDYRLVETWGGVIEPEERAETIAWVEARSGHPPRMLATCFVDRVIAGH